MAAIPTPDEMDANLEAHYGEGTVDAILSEVAIDIEKHYTGRGCTICTMINIRTTEKALTKIKERLDQLGWETKVTTWVHSPESYFLHITCKEGVATTT